MPLNIVLVEPEIHTNTGNIGRLSLASNSNLHLEKLFSDHASAASAYMPVTVDGVHGSAVSQGLVANLSNF